MKLLFDEMLGPSLVHSLVGLFQDSEHVRNLGLKRTPDSGVWHQAKNLGYAIVTKGKDFASLSLVLGCTAEGDLAATGELQRATEGRPSSPGCGPDFGIRRQLTERSTRHHEVAPSFDPFRDAVAGGRDPGRAARYSEEQEAPTMSTLDWSQCPAVESVPGKRGGEWVFRDTRMPVATVFENLEDMSVEEVMEEFDVTREQITAVLEFVAQSLKAPVSAPEPAPANAHSL